MYTSHAARNSCLNLSSNPLILAAMAALFPARRDRRFRACKIIDIISITCIINIKRIITIRAILVSVLILLPRHALGLMVGPEVTLNAPGYALDLIRPI